MSDVFISYARADEPAAMKLRGLLEAEGWDVWWDHDVYAGARWEATILAALAEAAVVVVAWSARSVASEWVRRELELAHAAVKLVPCSLDGTLLPAPYDALEAAMLRGWPEVQDHAELPVLFKGIEQLVKPSRAEDVRPGYEFGFLGSDIELPELPGVGDELPYLHFSVVINPARRLPWYVAYNTEPQTVKPHRPSGWRPDPRLSRLFQPDNAHFLGTGFDRGHVAAADTVAWGDRRHAEIAIRQAFFWTNTSPQTAIVNRHSWLRVEQLERGLAAERGRAVGFSGPVLRNDDPEHVVSAETRGRVRARRTFLLPAHYWKVTAVPAVAGAALQVAAFIVDNVNGMVPPRRLELAELEGITGLVFPGALRDAADL